MTFGKGEQFCPFTVYLIYSGYSYIWNIFPAKHINRFINLAKCYICISNPQSTALESKGGGDGRVARAAHRARSSERIKYEGRRRGSLYTDMREAIVGDLLL